MGRTISGAIDSAVILSVADPLNHGRSDNPLIITSTGMIASTGVAIDGIDGAATTAWTIANHGTVSSADGWGIALAGAGALSNSGVIEGMVGGFFAGGYGQVANKGTISGIGGYGVSLGAGGAVTNDGEIAGRYSGVMIVGGSGTVTNRGLISVDENYGVFLGAGGTVTNSQGSEITVDGLGVEIEGGFGALTNAGLIFGLSGVRFDAGGEVTNRQVGVISGEGYGVQVSGGSGRVTNAGMIVGFDGVSFKAGGSITNRNGGLIKGNALGVAISGGSGRIVNQEGGTISGIQGGVAIVGAGGIVLNSGTISGAFGYGVSLGAGGTVMNRADGTISGNLNGIEIAGGSATITDRGTIAGGAHSVLFGPDTTNNLLVVGPGAVFSGSADATSGTNSAIVLTPGAGEMTGIGGGAFDGFDTLVADPGASWTLSGPNKIGTVLNDGKLEVSGSLTVSAAVDPNSTGVFQLIGASTMDVAAAIGIGAKISFMTGSELEVDHVALFGTHVGASDYSGPLIEKFGATDTIDLKDFALPAPANFTAAFNPATGVLQLTDTAGAGQVADLAFSSLGGGKFHYAGDGGSGLLITRA